MNKNELRKIYKNRRDELFLKGKITEISTLILKNILNNEYFKAAKNVLFFCPKGSEINLLGLIDKVYDKNFFLPVCCGENLEICPFKKGDKLVLNKYKIYEPETKPVQNLEILDTVITPALCADKNFNRLGYGKGYYDRFFTNKNLSAKKIIVIPEEFLLDCIPQDRFDISCDLIITENNVYENF